MKRGWYNEAWRHSLAAKGIKTKTYLKKKSPKIVADPLKNGKIYPMHPNDVKQVLRENGDTMNGITAVRFTEPRTKEQEGAWAQYLRGKREILVFSQPISEVAGQEERVRYLMKREVLPHEIGHHDALYRKKITDADLGVAEARADAYVAGLATDDTDVEWFKPVYMKEKIPKDAVEMKEINELSTALTQAGMSDDDKWERLDWYANRIAKGDKRAKEEVRAEIERLNAEEEMGISYFQKKSPTERLAGRWEQVSVSPSTPSFQKNCERVQAQYTPQKDGTVRVENFCMEDGKKRSIVGKAYPTKKEGELKVDFFPGIPFTAGDFKIKKITGDSATIEGGKYTWKLKRVKDKKQYMYTPTYVAADLPLIAADGVGTVGAATVGLLPLVVAAGALYVGAKGAKAAAKKTSKKKKRSYKMVKEDDPRYRKWRELVNMSPKEIEEFKKTPEGKRAGLSRSEARMEGVRSGQDSANAIIKMRKKSPKKWTKAEEEWMERQNAFVSRMKGVKGPLYEGGRPTRKLTALKIWGHDPERNGVWQGNEFHRGLR